MAESEAHKDEVRNRVLSQRIKRLIQTGQYTPLKQENLEPVIKAKPLLLLNETEEPKGKKNNPTQASFILIVFLPSVFQLRERNSMKVMIWQILAKCSF